MRVPVHYALCSLLLMLLICVLVHYASCSLLPLLMMCLRVCYALCSLALGPGGPARGVGAHEARDVFVPLLVGGAG